MKTADFMTQLLLTLIAGLLLINLAYHTRRLIRRHGVLGRLRRR